MNNWYFPSRCGAETEGFSNAGIAEFRGNPLQALAREVCQNSLDAADGSGKPVRVEFHKSFIEMSKFPGMEQMKTIIQACQAFWGEDGDANTRNFLTRARKSFNNEKFFVLRVSDFNTKGVQGAYSEKNITPWGSLVKGNSFSVKADEKNAAGSFGIGKAAPFVSSYYQTVFYRTYDIDGNRAVLGVSRLMAHKIAVGKLLPGEDPIRRSVGYFGEDDDKRPAQKMLALDRIYERKEKGTDLFIPGFCYSTPNEEWVKAILLEIVENFLYSIYSGKLEVIVDSRKLTKETLPVVLSYLGAKAKNASMFYEVIRTNNKDVIEIERPFYALGNLRLRLLYANDLCKKILVVRNSGMKISTIPSLPRGISYVGFFELKGDRLNEFFRAMENPKHNAWEPSRHTDPKLAKRYKEEVEEWVRNIISEKLIELSGEESVIDIGDCFNFNEKQREKNQDERKNELLVDTVKDIDIIEDEPEERGKFKVKDLGGNIGQSNTPNRRGTIDDEGSNKGHRARTGSRKGGSPSGRLGMERQDGNDRIYSGKREVYVSARIINQGNGVNRLIFTAEDKIETGEMEIVTKGENGKTLQIYVLEATGNNISAVDGHIVIKNIPANVKQVAEFKIAGKRSYAMGVKAYGN